MRSLRGRLTLSYAIVVAVVLALLSVLGCRIAFEIAARSTFDGLAFAVARAENAASLPARSTPEAIAHVVAAASAPGIVVFAPGRRGGSAPTAGSVRSLGPATSPSSSASSPT